MKLYLEKNIMKFLIIVSAFLVPIQKFLILVGIAVTLDVLVAVYASVKLFGWESFQSKKLKDTVVKSAIYFLSVCLAHAVDLAFEFDWAAKSMAAFITITEMKSIDEKYVKIYGKSLFKVIFNLMPDMNKQKNN